jgi:hypothetical protein
MAAGAFLRVELSTPRELLFGKRAERCVLRSM